MAHSLLLNDEERRTVETVLKTLSNKSQKTITLDSLITSWSNFIRVVERGYDDSIYEYTNDLSVRDTLDRIIRELPESIGNKITELLQSLDARYNEATREVKKALAPGVKLDASSWWFRIPKKLCRELEDDLRSEGLLEEKK